MDSATAQQALESFKPTSSADLLSQAQAKYDVPALSSRVAALRGITDNLTNSIAAVDPSVTGRTSGSLVTEAQRSALVNREKQPLLTSLGKNNSDLNFAQGNLTKGQSLASSLAQALANDQNSQYNRLKENYTIASQREAAKQQQANADRQYQLQVKTAGSKGSGGGSSSSVDPAQEFLGYIASQFKAAGGQGNAKISRQQQDSWANAWFDKMGVSQANRQGYWDLMNRTYNRTADPTKDWRWAK